MRLIVHTQVESIPNDETSYLCQPIQGPLSLSLVPMCECWNSQRHRILIESR